MSVLLEMANNFFGNDDELDTEVETMLEESTKDIKVEHPGIEKMKAGAWEDKTIAELVKHFITLAKTKGKAAVMRSILNIERWNEKKNKPLSSKARSVINKLEASKQWENI